MLLTFAVYLYTCHQILRIAILATEKGANLKRMIICIIMGPAMRKPTIIAFFKQEQLPIPANLVALEL